MIRPAARKKLTSDDLDFICYALADSRREANALFELLTSSEDRDEILDAPELFEKLHVGSAFTKISTLLYFYILVRHALKKHDIDDREVSDYLASMLAEFSKPNRAEMISSSHRHQYAYLVDLLKALSSASKEERFLIQSHLGNYSLFLAGIFPDRIYHKAKYGRPAPDLSYYEQMGSSGYQNAAHSQLALKLDLAETLELLASQFRKIRFALNYMAGEYMQLDRLPHAMDRALRRIDDFINQRKNIM